MEASVDDGSSVTLVFYRVGAQWYKEPTLNILAAACQMSTFTHVEIAIGEEPGQGGMMKNVCRVFNDKIGVELVERTGRNPQYVYLQIGCSKAAERRMLHYARTQCVGKPFSNIGMVRSLLWPRHTDNTSFFCAELVAAILREGGLMDQQSNPGSATPETLHRIYKDRAAVAANPFVLRDVQASHGITLSSTVGGVFPRTRVLADDAAERESLLQSRAILAPAVGCNGSTRRPKPTGAAAVPQQRRAGEKRGDSPPRARFKVISEGQRMPGAGSHHHHHHHNHHQAAAQTGMTLTLNSLDMSRRV